MSTRICVEFGPDEAVILPDGLSSVELEKVRDWTKGKIDGKAQFFEKVATEDVEALRALRCLGRQRKGSTERFDTITFDEYDAYFIDEDGNEIEPDLMLDTDGDPILKNHGSAESPIWRPRVHKNDDGTERWVYVDTREPVKPAERPTRRRRKGTTASVGTPETP
jgi:hypothetical protein